MAESVRDKFGAICACVEKAMKRAGVPGVAVGILHHGETVTGGFGVTSVDNPLPVTSATLFQIGSITKTFTGTAVMRLVEAGKIGLDARVRRYLPEFKLQDEDAAANVTVRQLLTHMGGWDGDLFSDTGRGDDAITKYVAATSKRPQLAPLGAVWSYNNTGFAILGRIMEVVTDSTYEGAMRDLVFGPLQLTNAYLNPNDVMTLRYAVGHGAGPDGPVVARPWALPRGAAPAGTIVTNVEEMLKYARFHLGDGAGPDGARLLSPASLAAMHSPQAFLYGKEGWGLSFSVDDAGSTRQFGHGGGTIGHISLLTLVPEHDFAVIIVTNANEGGAVTKQVTEFAIQEYLGIAPDNPQPIEVTEAQLKEVEGRYTRHGSDIVLGVLGGKLVAQQIPTDGFWFDDLPIPPAPPPFPLVFCDRDRFLIVAGPMKDMKAEIVRRPDGGIGWIRVGYRILKRVE